MLIGIVVNNSIVLIDFVNKRRVLETSPRKAILRGRNGLIKGLAIRQNMTSESPNSETNTHCQEKKQSLHGAAFYEVFFENSQDGEAVYPQHIVKIYNFGVHPF
jgi:hypothetical protein